MRDWLTGGAPRDSRRPPPTAYGFGADVPGAAAGGGGADAAAAKLPAFTITNLRQVDVLLQGALNLRRRQGRNLRLQVGIPLQRPLQEQILCQAIRERTVLCPADLAALQVTRLGFLDLLIREALLQRAGDFLLERGLELVSFCGA